MSVKIEHFFDESHSKVKCELKEDEHATTSISMMRPGHSFWMPSLRDSSLECLLTLEEARNTKINTMKLVEKMGKK